MANLQCQDLPHGVQFDVLLLYNGSSHAGSDAMAPDQADKELGLGIAMTLCALLESRSLDVFLPYRNGQPGMCKFDAMEEVTRLPVEGWERDSTSVDLLLDRVAVAVQAVDEKTSPHRLARGDLQGPLTPPPLSCPPALCETTPCYTKVPPEDTPTQEVERTSDLSSTILKVPVTPLADSPGGGGVESLFHLPGKMYLGIRRLCGNLASREESTEAQTGEQEEGETPCVRSRVMRSLSLNFLHSLLSISSLPPPTQDFDV